MWTICAAGLERSSPGAGVLTPRFSNQIERGETDGPPRPFRKAALQILLQCLIYLRKKQNFDCGTGFCPPFPSAKL